MSDSEKKEEELLQRYKNGDKGAFESLIGLHQVGAVRFAQRYVKDTYMAEDIAQEAFAYIYVNREKFKEKYSFKTYLYTIIRNKSVDYIRKNSRIEFSYDIENSIGNNIWEEEWRGSSPETKHIKKEEQEYMRNCIKKLKPEYISVIHLYEYEDLSYKEIAKVLGKNTAQVKINLYRARRKLQEIYIKGAVKV